MSSIATLFFLLSTKAFLNAIYYWFLKIFLDKNWKKISLFHLLVTFWQAQRPNSEPWAESKGDFVLSLLDTFLTLFETLEVTSGIFGLMEVGITLWCALSIRVIYGSKAVINCIENKEKLILW
jgi:hypothetical protein